MLLSSWQAVARIYTVFMGLASSPPYPHPVTLSSLPDHILLFLPLRHFSFIQLGKRYKPNPFIVTRLKGAQPWITVLPATYTITVSTS